MAKTNTGFVYCTTNSHQENAQQAQMLPFCFHFYAIKTKWIELIIYTYLKMEPI